MTEKEAKVRKVGWIVVMVAAAGLIVGGAAGRQTKPSAPTTETCTSVDLTAAEVQNLVAAPKEIVAAPGIGKVVFPGDYKWEFRNGTAGYSDPADARWYLQFGTDPAWAFALFTGSQPTGYDHDMLAFGNASSDQGHWSAAAPTATYANQPLSLTRKGAELSGGDGTVTFELCYRITDA